MDLLKLKDVLVTKIKDSPKIPIYLAVVMLCVFLLFATSSSDSQKDDDIDIPPATQTEYAEFLENELKDIISKIDGIGNVKVMVTVEGTVSYEYVVDVTSSDNKIESDTVLLANKEALIKQIVNPKVSGVLVICDGGDSAVIKEKVTRAVSTVLDISSSKVYITK